MLRIREINPESKIEITLVANRMRQTLIEVLGEEKGTSLYSMEWLENRVRWHLDESVTTARIFVIENQQNEIIAQAIVRIENQNDEKPFGYFSTLYVEPGSRNRGIASSLILHVEDWLKSMGMSKVVYNTAANHSRLIRFFCRHGFEITHGESEMVQLTKELVTNYHDIFNDSSHSWILLTLLELNVLDHLSDAPASLHDLALKCQASPERLKPLLKVLVAKNILKQTADEIYRFYVTNSATLREIKSMANEVCRAVDQTIAEFTAPYISVLKSNKPIEVAASGGNVTQEKREEFQKRIDSESLDRANEVAQILGSLPFSKLADVGCGSGIYSFALLEKQPSARAILYDRANAEKYLSARSKELGIEQRVEFKPLSLPLRNSNDELDLILLSNFTHCLNEAENFELFSTLERMLSANGHLVVKDYVIDENRIGPLNALVFDATMAIYSKGKLHSRSELKKYAIEAGLTEKSFQHLNIDQDSFLQIFSKRIK